MTITTTRSSTAAPATVHALLVDVATWALWSPHVASVEPPTGAVAAGDVVRTRAFFSPAVTPMHVDWVTPSAGIGWHSTAAGIVLRYENRLAPAPGGGTTLEWTADLEGPGADVLAAVTGPLSRLGQRRRMDRLARLAEVVEARG